MHLTSLFIYKIYFINIIQISIATAAILAPAEANSNSPPFHIKPEFMHL